MRKLLAFVLAALLSAGPSRADMFPDASNAKLPAARTNLGAAAGDGASINPVKDGYGAVCDGTADDTTAINNAIAALMGGKGGTLVLPGMCRMNGPVVLPRTVGPPPYQKPLRITGIGPSWEGLLQGNDPGGGAGLDLRYACTGSAVAKIDTRGAGMLEIDHLTIKSGGPDNCLIFQTTNTTVNIHDNHFVGNPNNSGTSAQQDALQLGGITDASATLATDAATAGFQGYGSKISNNLFSHIRHAINFGGSANGVYVVNNTTDLTCGSGEPNGAAYVFYGAGLGTMGNVISGGIIEMKHYPQAVAFLATTPTAATTLNFLSGLGLYDENMGAPTVGAYYFASATQTVLNTIIDGYVDLPLLEAPAMNGPGAGKNTHINGSRASVFYGGLSLGIDTASQQALATDATGKIVAKAWSGTGPTVLQTSPFISTPNIVDNWNVQGGGSGTGAGPVGRFQFDGVTKSAIGGYSAITGGAFNKNLTFYDVDLAYHFIGMTDFPALKTDATGKLGAAPTIGTGAILMGTTTAAWTPTDISGAGLTFTTKDTTWVRNGKTCTVSGQITYPTTVNTALATIGLPCPTRPGTAAHLAVGNISADNMPGAYTARVTPDNVNLLVWRDATAAFATNASLSGAVLSFTITYITN